MIWDMQLDTLTSIRQYTQMIDLWLIIMSSALTLCDHRMLQSPLHPLRQQ